MRLRSKNYRGVVNPEINNGNFFLVFVYNGKLD